MPYDSLDRSPPGTSRLPDAFYEGSYRDSRFGGVSPWQQSLRDYAALGSPNFNSRRPFEGLGKTDISGTLPFAPPVRQMHNAAPQVLGAPQPGLFEAVGGGLSYLGSELLLGAPRAVGLGSGHLDNAQQLLTNVVGGAGSVLDGILDFIPVMDFLPGGGDIESQYEALESDPLKKEYDRLIAQNPLQRMEYMHQYLTRRGPELARSQGVSGMFAELATPSMNFSEQLRRILFGGMMAAGDAVARTYVGSLRDVDGTVLNADMASLPEELQDIRKRYERGELTRDEMLDSITLSPYRWTQDTGVTGLLISTIMDIASDPLVWASFGTGAAAKAGVAPAVSALRMNVARSVRSGSKASQMAAELAPKLKLTPDEVMKTARPDHRAAITDWAKVNDPDSYRAGMGKLGTKQRAYVELEPIITPAAKVAENIDSMFGFFGAGPLARRMRMVKNNNYATGYIRAMGVPNMRILQGLFDDFGEFNTNLGVAIGNGGMADNQSMLRDTVLGWSDAEKRAGAVATGDVSPTALTREAYNIDMAEGLATNGEKGFFRRMETFLRGTGDIADASMRESVDSIVRGLSHITGKPEAIIRASVEKLDGKGLAGAHELIYGATIRQMDKARADLLETLNAQHQHLLSSGKTTEAAELANKIALVERYTLVSENTLTKNVAEKLLQTIKKSDDAGRQAARDALAQYDQLDVNWGKSVADLSDEELRTNMVTHLEELLRKDGRLLDVLDDAKLDPSIKSALDATGNRYHVGLAPTDTWGVVKNASGEVISVNSFVQTMSDFTGPLARKLNTFDRIREGLTGPITGSRIHAENKMRMRSIAVSTYGMTRRESDSLFDAITREAISSNKGTRAWTMSELDEIAQKVVEGLPARMETMYGPRALMDLVSQSFVGDVRTMGLANYASSRIKTSTRAMGDNLITRIAEDIYPKVRFTYSPMFLAMELTESPFFALLRGVKPGWRWTERDANLNAIVASIRPGYQEFGAGIGRGMVAMGDKEFGLKVSELTRFDRLRNKVMPRSMRRQRHIQGPRVFNVYEGKRLMYNRQIGNQMGESFVRALSQTEEGQRVLGLLQETYNTTDNVDLWVNWMLDRGAYDPSKRHNLHLFDASLPSDMPRSRIRIKDVASYLGRKNHKELIDDINAGRLTYDQFRDQYERVGADSGFIDRAWHTAKGFTEEQWEASIRDVMPDPKEADSAINFHKIMAKKLNLSYEEFLNLQYTKVAQIADKASKVPGVALKQTVRQTLGDADMIVETRGSAIFEATRKRTQELLPKPAEDTPGSLPRKIGNARKRLDEGAPPSLTAELKGLDSDDLLTREGVYEQMWTDLQTTLGTPDNVQSAANWYDEMLTTFIGLSHKMPIEQVNKMLKTWEASVKRQVAKATDKATKDQLQSMLKSLDGMDEAALRQELAARLNIAFSGTQMNMSVLEGMKRVAALLEEVANDLDKDGIIQRIAEKRGIPVEEAATKYQTRFGFSVVVDRLDALLKDFADMPPQSLGQKLSDFNDNLAGNFTRTADGGVSGMQPAAMDIWMNRVFNFGDTAYLDYLTTRHMEANGVSREAAEAAVLKERGWDKSKLTHPKQPNEVQYEWMLTRTNEMKDWLNKTGIPGPNGQWTANEIQAVLWVGLQKELEYPDSPVFSLFQQVGAGITPAGELKHYPNRMELVKHYGDEADSILNSVQREVSTNLLSGIVEELGMTPLRVIDGVGRGATQTVFGTKDQSINAARRLAAALDEPVYRVGKGTNHGVLDISFPTSVTSAQSGAYMRSLSEWVAQYLPDHFAHQTSGVLETNAVSLRNITKKKQFDDPLPLEVRSKLNDGSWVKDIDPDAELMPLEITVDRVDFEVVTPDEGRKFVGDSAMVDRLRSDAIDATDEAYASYAPEAFEASGRRAALAGDGGGTVFNQRTGAGRVRAGFEVGHRTGGHTLHFVRNSADASSAIHESFHLFSRLIDDSARTQFVDAYNRAHGLTGRSAKRRFTREVEEWVSAEFEAFANGDLREAAPYAATFKAFAEWGKDHPSIPKGSVIDDVFDKVLTEWNDIPYGFNNLDEFRIIASTRAAFLRAEDEAHSTGYYRRGRSWLQRSINHPYLGLYPASYMWGKVLPELTRFLVRRPFGLKAPLGGMMMFNHFFRNMQYQLNTDTELADWVEGHPETVRFLSLMVPGSPTEIPVNLPVVGRRAIESWAESEAAKARGETPDTLGTEPLKWFGDAASYAVGFTNLFGNVADIADEWMGDNE